jgi:putative transposase
MALTQVRQTQRLRPSGNAERHLLHEYGKCRWLWNSLVTESKDRYLNDPGSTFGYAEQDKFLTSLRNATTGAVIDSATGTNWLSEGSSVAQQQLVRDFSKSRKKALLDRKNKITATKRHGLPRYKKRDKALPNLNYTRRGFSLKQHPGTGRLVLALPGGVTIPVVWTQELPSEPKSVRVYRDSLGHWYASFVVEIDLDHTRLPDTGNDHVLGIDWGVTETATTAVLDIATGEVDDSGAFDLIHSEYGKKAAARLARYQRMMARRKPTKGQSGSNGYKDAKRKTAAVYAKVARQRQDGGRKWAKHVVTHHDKIAVEDFKPKFLAKSTMAKKAADAAISATKTELIWMAAKHGRQLHLVHPANTTTDCSSCGARTKHRLPLGQRTYLCESCGMSKPRDKNSAAVVAARAGFHPADAEGVRPQRAAVRVSAA